MEISNLALVLDELNLIFARIKKVLNLSELSQKAKVLETQSVDVNLWDNPERGQQVTSELARIQAQINKCNEIQNRLEDLTVLLELITEAADNDSLMEAQTEASNLQQLLQDLEINTMLSGPYDARQAVVTIRAGAGGDDATDWAEMLFRMYIRWAEKHEYEVNIYDVSYAEGAGIKSATFIVAAQFAYGLLSVEMGIHRLVRISPFDHQSRRHTSFAEVEVLPEVELTDAIEISEADIRIDVYRSSGPGGQSVNTTDSAVRVTHLPTGIVVTCQNEKSQLQNKTSALKVLKAKLLELKQKEEQAELATLKGTNQNSWGGQMRSYVLHPYQMVKDLRTEYEVGNPQTVLDGNIDGFIEAGIKWRLQQLK